MVVVGVVIVGVGFVANKFVVDKVFFQTCIFTISLKLPPGLVRALQVYSSD